jgi:vacuolar-type H+-ATPase subunit I/STV1
MRKLRVITLEDDVDAVVRSLDEAGIVQFIDMREKVEEWNGILASQVVSTEVLTKCSDLLSKIDASFENLGLKHEELHSKKIPITKEPIEEVLAKVEQKLAELPVEALTKCSALTSRITQLIEILGVKPEEIKEVTLKKPVEESLAEIEYELSEIEKTAETTGLIDRQAMVDRIKTVAAREEIDVHKKLAEFARVHILESKPFFAKRLLALKKLVEKARESIEAETKLGKTHEGLLTLRKIVEIEKQVAEEQKKFVRSAKTVYFEAWVSEYNVLRS